MNSKFCYVVADIGYDSVDGDFYKEYYICDTPEIAYQKYEEVKKDILKNETFIKGKDIWEHIAMPESGIKLPVLTINSTGEDWYELHVAETDYYFEGGKNE